MKKIRDFLYWRVLRRVLGVCVMLFSKTSVVWMVLAFNVYRTTPASYGKPPLVSVVWKRSHKESLVCLRRPSRKVAARDGATGAPEGASKPSSGSSTPRPLGPDVAAWRRSTHPLTMGIWLLNLSVPATDLRSRRTPPGPHLSRGFFPPARCPVGSHSPSRTGSERVNLRSPCEEHKQWVAVFRLLAAV